MIGIFSSVETFCMKYGFTNKGEANKASLANPGKRAITPVFGSNFCLFCNTCDGVVCFILHVINEFVTRMNQQIAIVINKCSCINLSGFLFCEKTPYICVANQRAE